jgi:hypothetical protein
MNVGCRRIERAIFNVTKVNVPEKDVLSSHSNEQADTGQPQNDTGNHAPPGDQRENQDGGEQAKKNHQFAIGSEN